MWDRGIWFGNSGESWIIGGLKWFVANKSKTKNPAQREECIFYGQN